MTRGRRWGGLARCLRTRTPCELRCSSTRSTVDFWIVAHKSPVVAQFGPVTFIKDWECEK
jgi:hypothetical protein